MSLRDLSTWSALYWRLSSAITTDFWARMAITASLTASTDNEVGRILRRESDPIEGMTSIKAISLKSWLAYLNSRDHAGRKPGHIKYNASRPLLDNYDGPKNVVGNRPRHKDSYGTPDHYKFRGAFGIQVTGYDNHSLCYQWLRYRRNMVPDEFLPLIVQPVDSIPVELIDKASRSIYMCGLMSIAFLATRGIASGSGMTNSFYKSLRAKHNAVSSVSLSRLILTRIGYDNAVNPFIPTIKEMMMRRALVTEIIIKLINNKYI